MRLVKILIVLCTAILLAGVVFHTAVLTADGGRPMPIPPKKVLVADGGRPLPIPKKVLVADGGRPMPIPPKKELVADGGRPIPIPPKSPAVALLSV